MPLGQYQGSSNRNISLGATTSTEIIPAVSSQRVVRTQMIITNTSAAATVTIAKQSTAATANAGIPLLPNGTYLEATDGGYICYQGAVQAYGTVAGSVAIVESFDYINPPSAR